MSHKIRGLAQTLLAILSLVGLVVLDMNLPGPGLPFLGLVAVLAVASAVAGPRLPLFLRLLATGATLYVAYSVCLVGRTMEPSLSAYTCRMALMMFAIYAALPTLALVRIWPKRVSLGVVAGMFPAALLIASGVASYEESLFVRQHPNGGGPTARWTVPHHWLAYDPRTGVLSGSD